MLNNDLRDEWIKVAMLHLQHDQKRYVDALGHKLPKDGQYSAIIINRVEEALSSSSRFSARAGKLTRHDFFSDDAEQVIETALNRLIAKEDQENSGKMTAALAVAETLKIAYSTSFELPRKRVVRIQGSPSDPNP